MGNKDVLYFVCITFLCQCLGSLTIKPTNSNTLKKSHPQQCRAAGRVVIKQLEHIHASLQIQCQELELCQGRDIFTKELSTSRINKVDLPSESGPCSYELIL